MGGGVGEAAVQTDPELVPPGELEGEGGWVGGLGRWVGG